MLLFYFIILITLFTLPAFAISEGEVQAQVDAVGRESVTGNLLIWFLCAVAFLKVSQKIDSFMSSLGINVGHTGGSMLAEAMIAARTITTVAGAAGHAFGGTGAKAKGTDRNGSGMTSFLHGGLAGVVSRKITNDAIKTATSKTQATATHSATKSASAERVVQADHVATGTTQSQSTTTQQRTSTAQRSSTATHRSSASYRASAAASVRSGTITAPRSKGLGGAIFASSLQAGGSFANDVIGRVARGDIRSTGSITGDMASQSLKSYMGLTALGGTHADEVAYRDVEIGGGRISGVETTPDHPRGIAFAMYHAEQYAKPDGAFQEVTTADGARWYRQYARDAVESTPYKAPDGEVAYSKEIVKKLPKPPQRKDRI